MKKKSNIDVQELKKLSDSGMTCKEIADKMNYSISAIYSCLKRNDIKINPRKYDNNYIDMKNKCINGVRVIHRVENKTRGRGQQLAQWLCICPCGKEFKAIGTDLRLGKTKTCGCRKSIKSKTSWKGYGNIPKTYWSSINKNAEQRSIKFDISIQYCDDLLKKQNKKCALSGVDLELKAKHSTASLDRIDSSKGYIEGNVQWVHKNINKCKQKLDNNEFIELCKKVAKHNE